MAQQSLPEKQTQSRARHRDHYKRSCCKPWVCSLHGWGAGAWLWLLLDHEPRASLGTSLCSQRTRCKAPGGVRSGTQRCDRAQTAARAPGRAPWDASRAGSTDEKSWEPQISVPAALVAAPGAAEPLRARAGRAQRVPRGARGSPAGLAPLCAAATLQGTAPGPAGHNARGQKEPGCTDPAAEHSPAWAPGSAGAHHKPQQSRAGAHHKPQQSGAALLCAKSSCTVSLPPELSLPTARSGAHIWELFNDLQTPRAAALSPTTMSVPSELLVR